MSVEIAIIMTMIVGRVGDKTQPMTLILHPDIGTDILRLEVEGEMNCDETKITQCLCSNCLFIESTTTLKDRLDLHSTMSSPIRCDHCVTPVLIGLGF